MGLKRDLSFDLSEMGRRSVEAIAQITQRWAEAIKLRDRVANAIQQLRKTESFKCGQMVKTRNHDNHYSQFMETG